MSDKYSFLEYTFLFNTDTGFSNIYEFESQLKDFFAAFGLEAEIVKTIDGQFGRRILLIRKIDTIPGNVTNTSVPPIESIPKPKVPMKVVLNKFRK